MYHGVSENFEHLIFMDGKLSAKTARIVFLKKFGRVRLKAKVHRMI